MNKEKEPGGAYEVPKLSFEIIKLNFETTKYVIELLSSNML